MSTHVEPATIEQLSINTIRTLSMDAVQAANSGHPGTPMAMAERWLAAHFNRPGFELFNYNVYALAGDGDMMEGISSEAASLAGHLKLSNLCWIYDNNRISIEGATSLAFSEDVATRFIAYGWNVTRVGDANDLEMLEPAFRTFQATQDRTVLFMPAAIAYGSCLGTTKEGVAPCNT